MNLFVFLLLPYTGFQIPHPRLYVFVLTCTLVRMYVSRMRKSEVNPGCPSQLASALL